VDAFHKNICRQKGDVSRFLDFPDFPHPRPFACIKESLRTSADTRAMPLTPKPKP
jgi:hypothetical protein